MRESPRWRGWAFFYVTTYGQHNPIEVARDWTLPQVLDAYHGLRLKFAMESF